MPASQVDVSFNLHFPRLSFCGPGQDSGLTIVTNGEYSPLWLSINEDQLRTHEVVGTGSMTLFGGRTDCEHMVRRVGHSSPDLSEW